MTTGGTRLGDSRATLACGRFTDERAPDVRTIAILNQKGGCGKTTVSINLAATFAAKGQKTLLVDMDPQGHCALGLAVPDGQIDHSVTDLLRHGMNGQLGISEITWQISRNLDLAPSSVSLAGIEQLLANASDRDRRLAQVLAPVADRYDLCIIDCPPSIGLLTFNALRASDEVLVPVETGYFAMQGSFRQEQTIEMLTQKVGHACRFRVLPTLYDVRTKLAREILSELKKHFGDKLLPLVINFNAKLKEAASFGQPITEYDAGSRGMQDFDELAAWLMANPPMGAATPAVNEQAPGASAPHEHHAAERNGLSSQAEAAPAAPTNPALSRAAELVERARELSTRTANLSQRLTRGMNAAGIDPAPRPASSESGPAPAQAAPTVPKAQDDTTTIQPAASAVEPAPQRPGLKEKLDKIYGVRPTNSGILFVQPTSGSARIGVAGDFNNWNPSATPLTRNEELDVWQACIRIPPGRYRYRLVVDGQWVQDPYNQETETNPFGELNNILEVA
ncbi:MAG: AAA family ATPase [Planctomycetota bacterium]